MPEDDIVSETMNYAEKESPAADVVKDAQQANEAPPAKVAQEGESIVAATDDDADSNDGSDASDDVEAPEDAAHSAADDGADKPKAKGNAWQKRIDKITREKHDALRKIEAIEAERDLYRRMAQGETVQNQQPDATDADASRQPVQQPNLPQYGTQQYQNEVQREAQRIAAEQDFNNRFKLWESSGLKDYPDFRDRCETLAALGATENKDFVPALLDIDNGAKVAAKLAENPDEATRILSLPTTKMISELTKMGLDIGKPKAKAVSKAPAPIRPVDGSAQVTDEILPDDSEQEFYRKWEAKEKKKTLQRYGHL